MNMMMNINVADCPRPRASRTLILLVLLSLFPLLGQVPAQYKLQQQDADRSGLVGNGITDLFWHNGVLYAGTGFGLSTSNDDGMSWTNFTEKEYGGQGGVSAITAGPDGTIWIATAYDTLVEEDESLQIGGGLRFLEPGSSEWQFVPQPVDAQGDTTGGMKPTTTRVQNVTFDIAVLDTQLYISSFGGGVRRSLDRGQTWEIVTTDGRPFDALGELNHRGFSAVSDTSGNIWIGTVGGISKSADGGNTWERFTPTNRNQPISGSWVIGLFNNPWDNSVWATTLRAVDTTEFNSISRTRNGGLSWDLFLVDELSDGTFPRYVAFYDSAVYAATEKGVYKSIDDGANWLLLPPIRDLISGEGLFTSTFYSVATSPAMAPNHRLWVGSLDGMASTANSGFDWTVFRSFVSTRTDRTDPAVYAYPNPYSPIHSDRPCRFQFDIEAAGNVSIDIYNFAMERVTTLSSSQGAPLGGSFDRTMTWDGRDNNGRLVDNGVYFFRASVGGEVTWGKIVIIN